MVGLYAMRFLKEHGIKLKNDIMLVFGLNEEKGSADMPEFLKREKAPKWSLVPDSKFPVGHAEIGFIRAKFAIPDLGDELVEIHGGEATNSVPDRAYAVVSGCTVEEVRGKIGQYGADHRRGRCQRAFAFWLPVTPACIPSCGCSERE